MAVNERVMTVLFSSAQVSLKECEQSFSSGLCGLQVTARVCTVWCFWSNSATRSTSVVSPERDISTTCSAPRRRSVSSGREEQFGGGHAGRGNVKVLGPEGGNQAGEVVAGAAADKKPRAARRKEVGEFFEEPRFAELRLRFAPDSGLGKNFLQRVLAGLGLPGARRWTGF